MNKCVEAANKIYSDIEYWWGAPRLRETVIKEIAGIIHEAYKRGVEDMRKKAAEVLVATPGGEAVLQAIENAVIGSVK